MDPGTFVILHLTGPKEQFWGRLIVLGPTGVTLRGVNLNSFEDWARQVGRREERTMEAVPIFFPMHRIERMFEDEDMGIVASYRRRFKELAGLEAVEYFQNVFGPSPSAD
jgi:hypothetical protein